MPAPLSYGRFVAITKSDTVNFDGSVSTTGQSVTPCDAIWVGTEGVVAVVAQNGVVTNFSCFIGSGDSGVLPVRAIRVNSTNTTASGMVALYASP